MEEAKNGEMSHSAASPTAASPPAAKHAAMDFFTGVPEEELGEEGEAAAEEEARSTEKAVSRELALHLEEMNFDLSFDGSESDDDDVDCTAQLPDDEGFDTFTASEFGMTRGCARGCARAPVIGLFFFRLRALSSPFLSGTVRLWLVFRFVCVSILSRGSVADNTSSCGGSDEQRSDGMWCIFLLLRERIALLSYIVLVAGEREGTRREASTPTMRRMHHLREQKRRALRPCGSEPNLPSHRRALSPVVASSSRTLPSCSLCCFLALHWSFLLPCLSPSSLCSPCFACLRFASFSFLVSCRAFALLLTHVARALSGGACGHPRTARPLTHQNGSEFESFTTAQA